LIKNNEYVAQTEIRSFPYPKGARNSPDPRYYAAASGRFWSSLLLIEEANRYQSAG
jgi:hypothetical protein